MKPMFDIMSTQNINNRKKHFQHHHDYDTITSNNNTENY